MSKLNSRPVDPRDQRWEVWTPRYRVHFWKSGSTTGWASREFEVWDGDVVEVLDWAEAHADDGESFTVFAVVGEDDRLGLARLAGAEPTRGSDA
jgi:hypothetical protein